MKNKTFLLVAVCLLGLGVAFYYHNQSYAIEAYNESNLNECVDETIVQLEAVYGSILQYQIDK